MSTNDSGGDDAHSPSDSPTVDFAQYRARRLRLRLLDLLEALIVAMERRDLQTVWDVLDEEDAIRWFPAGVRQEALVIAKSPTASLRAPIRTYQFFHQLQQLAGEPLERTDDPSQLVLDLSPLGATLSILTFPEKSDASPDDPREGGGAHRRRSGSR
jgi:hypothetical protein